MFSINEYTSHSCISQVLNTLFWLGKAASGCASYSGPTLNLKEFEVLLAQMRLVSELGEEDRGGGGRNGRNTDSGMEEVRGMDFVSCLCWGAAESHQTGDKHIFVFVTTQPLLLFQGDTEQIHRTKERREECLCTFDLLVKLAVDSKYHEYL